MPNFVRCRHLASGATLWGRKSGNGIRILTQAPWLPSCRETNEELKPGDVSLLAPVEPSKIIALGYNYKDVFTDKETEGKISHYSSAGFEPVVFLKAPNAIAGPSDPIRLPKFLDKVWAEVELAIVIGRRVKDCKDEDEARAAIFGYTIANDVTALNILERDWHLARSKSLDGFCPIGPELVTGIDVERRELRTRINGVVSQSSNTANRVLNSFETVRFVSSLMTLEAGDVIITGTPPGARFQPVKAGDRVELEIDSLGILSNDFV